MEKLSVKSLQIGDYVNYRGQIIKVTSLYDKGGSNEVGWSDKESVWVNGRCIEPIPLTPEILKKNSFYYGYTRNEENLAFNTNEKLSEGNKGWCFDEGCGAIKVMFPNETDCGMLVIDDQSFDRHLDFVYSATIHVHELQHTLRLCGIEKEIVL